MAYLEMSYYRDCALELREHGDTGWAIHIYARRSDQQARKIGIVTTAQASALKALTQEAHDAVDAHLGPVPMAKRSTLLSVVGRTY
jgi:hypothetical protein